MSAIERVLQAALQSTEDLCSTAMGLDVTLAEESDPPDVSPSGPYGRASIAVGSDRVAMRLSLVACLDTCTKLANALMGGCEDADIDGEELDVADGVGEMMNIIAGGVKKQLNESYPALKVGLPVWTVGAPAEKCPRTARAETRPMLIGGNLVQLRVMMGVSARSLPFPEPDDIVDLFTALTAGKLKKTKVAKQTTLRGKQTVPFFVGLYQAENESSPSGAMLIDLPLAFAASGAMSGLPPGVVLEDLKAGEITADMQANVHELLNIAGSLLNATFAPHLRLTELCELGSATPEGLKRLLAKKPRRLDLAMDIAPCPPGRLIVLRASSAADR